MEVDVKCCAIAPASNPASERLVTIQFGIELDVTKAHAATGMPVLWDNRAVLFVPEKEWRELKDKFTVGDDFAMSMKDNEITIRKK